MSEFNRNIYLDLNIWFSRSDRKPLLLRGARQVGKSHAIRTWGKTQVEHFIEINFEERPNLAQVFEHDLVIERILDELTLALGVDLRRPSTLIFFDEIQEAPKAITALRYFYEKAPHIPVIAAGSLIEFILEEVGMPVGRVESLDLHPLTFYEFLNSIGKTQLTPYLLNLPIEEPVSLVVHEELLQLLKKYFYIGGMPKAVQAYLQTNSLPEASKVHQEILSLYEDDFAKYSRASDWNALRLVFQKSPFFVGDTRVKYARFDKEMRTEKIKRALSLLTAARVLSQVKVVRTPELPLKAHAEVELFKILFLDIGLMQSSLGVDWQVIPVGADLTKVFNGALAEQFVGQELRACGKEKELYYWERDKHGSDAEVDYLIQQGASIVPIEVKSGAKGTFKSLQRYINDYEPLKAFVLSQKNYERNESFSYVPLYRAGQIALRS